MGKIGLVIQNGKVAITRDYQGCSFSEISLFISQLEVLKEELLEIYKKMLRQMVN